MHTQGVNIGNGSLSITPLTVAVLLTTSALPNPVCTGSSAALSVTVANGTAPYSYTWAAPAGIALSGSSTSAVTATASAGVSGVQTLTVTVMDAANPSLTATATLSLTVNTAVGITQQPPVRSVVCAGSTVTAMVSASGSLSSGSATLGYQWYRNGVAVSSQTSATLTLSSVSVADAGSYSVVVTGACTLGSPTGLTSTAFTLVVRPLATRLFVNDDATGANNGSSWTDAFTNLQDALTYPCAGLTEIWVAGGFTNPHPSPPIKRPPLGYHRGCGFTGVSAVEKAI